MEKPEIINRLEKELIAAIEEDDKACLSVDRVSKIFGVDCNSFYVAIANGTCPFGFGGQHRTTGSRFGRISKIALWYWITKGGAL